MKAEDIIKILKKNKISAISDNSKQISTDSAFIAVKGSKIDASKFIDEAVEGGAKVIICDSRSKVKEKDGVIYVRVKDTRKALARLSCDFYKDPSVKLKVVGVTGTNGKTTITYLLEALLTKARLSTAVLGTINYRYNNKVIPAKNTTPGPLQLQSMFARMFKEKVKYVVMEVSSHALDQERVLGISYHSALFTNLTQDHLDYHKNIRNYFLAKARLFKNISPKSFVVLNNDDKYSRMLKKLTRARIITYGIDNNSDVMAKEIKFNVSFTEFKLAYLNKVIDFKMRLIGKHNIYNMLAVIAWGLKEGFDINIIKQALENFALIPGRLERIKSQKGFSVFVDYAHTDDALKNILISLRQLAPSRIFTLFGCGGERDKSKRPKMGRVVTELSDFSVITSDNPRSEKPKDIIRDILCGIEKNNYIVIQQRAAAIRKILSLAKKGDIVVLAGKGHEDYQILYNKTVHFSDREEVRKCLKSLN
jgi:UDP-N-acetylmuramoyl-L-alanyl-D-glutamate--2,6-diaminopimelate ligase